MGQISRNRNYDLILKLFILMWILTVVGVLFALLLPISVVILLSIICIGMIVFTFIMRLGSVIIFIIPFLMGVLHFLFLVILIEWLGAALVVSVFIGTILIFLLIALIGMRFVIVISDVLIYFFTVLIVFVVFGFIYIFIPVSSTFFLVVAGIFVLAFALYTVYEIDVMRSHYIRESEIILFALRLYLNLLYVVIEIGLSSKKFRY
ncbi:hypothetical protein ACH0B5_05950 [Ureibacillus sp. 179-F W5.1 NHS]|uniref:hypothetical protein n=1 Tax=unclassified Ureibacillus TaxID=2638520 RepID=UPI00311A1946